MADNNQPAKKEMSKTKRTFIGCGLLIFLIVAFSIAGMNGISQVQEEKADQEKTAFENPSKLNDPVIVSDVQWTLVEAKELGSTLKTKYTYGGKDCVANSGKFIQIKVKVKNNGKEMVTLSNLDLLDSEKREYKTSSDVFSCIADELFILTNVNPGIENTFTAVYEVPADAKGFRLKVGDLNIFNDDYKYISLGF